MFTKFPPNIQGLLLGFLGFSCFAIADSSAKWLTMHYPVFQVVGTNAFITLATCVLLSPFLGGFKRTFQSKKMKIHMLRGVLNSIISLLVVYSFAHLPLTTAYTIFFLCPFVIVLLAIPLFKEKIDRHGWIATAGGFVGVLIIFRPGLADLNMWLFVALAAVLFIALLGLSARALTNEETILSLGLFPALSNFFFIMPPAIFIYGFPDIQHLPVFMLSGISIIGGLVFVALAFRVGKFSIVAPVQYSQILWGAVIGYFIFGDTLDLWMLAGATVIIASGIYLLESERRSKL